MKNCLKTKEVIVGHFILQLRFEEHIRENCVKILGQSGKPFFLTPGPNK